jgi:protocatechuate 3,4-dioxygenase beta subunit
LARNRWREAFDLTKQHSSEPVGERIVVSGRVIDEDGRPVRETLIDIWQANAAGRYRHKIDQHDAPLDPNFTGVGHTLTDSEGRYRFVTVRPGAYPWKNHYNAWRPPHIHFSIVGSSWMNRFVTQIFFPGEPLIPLTRCSIARRTKKRIPVFRVLIGRRRFGSLAGLSL